jgi:N-methylhydantoinase A
MSYRIAVDIGGTFTDCTVVSLDGKRWLSKSLTTPGQLDDGVLSSIDLAAQQMDLSLAELLSATEQFVHGTTQATNAILTRNGARAGLITTRGHEQSLLIGRVYAKVAGLSERDIVHASRLAKPAPIIPRSLIRGVTERIDRDGDVVIPLADHEVISAVDELVAAGVESIAVSFLWSFLNDSHEKRVLAIIEERAPHLFVAASHVISPVIGEYERTATTAMTAYIGPIVVGYLETLEGRLRDAGLSRPMLVMQASGGLTSVADASRRPLVTLDSGPTGGILGSASLGRDYGFDNLICTDVGGTSFDVGLIVNGTIPFDDEPVISQFSLRMPKVLVDAIGAGGGSIAWLDDAGLLRVGPQSASSRPGPVCYSRGGTEPTVTDADLVLGYLDPNGFLGGQMSLDRDAALHALAQLGKNLGLSAEEAALGIFRIINAQMADLILRSTIEQGHDPRECALVAYGGAGPTHAAFYGQDIGAKTILIPASSTVFSANGMLTCDLLHTEQSTHLVASPFDADDIAVMNRSFAELESRVVDQFLAEGLSRADVRLSRYVNARFKHQVNGLQVPVDAYPITAESAPALVHRFAEQYRGVYGDGAVLEDGQIEIELYRIVGTVPVSGIEGAPDEVESTDPAPALTGERLVYFEGSGFSPTNVYSGQLIRPGNVIVGPAVIQRMGDSVVVPPSFRASVDGRMTIRLDRTNSPGN